MQKANKKVFVVGAKDQVKDRLHSLGLDKVLPSNIFYEHRVEALEHLQDS